MHKAVCQTLSDCCLVFGQIFRPDFCAGFVSRRRLSRSQPLLYRCVSYLHKNYRKFSNSSPLSRLNAYCHNNLFCISSLGSAMIGTIVLACIFAFRYDFTHFCSNPNPRLSWTIVNNEEQNFISVETNRRPHTVTVWMAQTKVRNKRDFRLTRLGKNGIVGQNCQYRKHALKQKSLDSKHDCIIPISH